MAQKPMYPAVVNSPGTEITTDISATDTTITVTSVISLPPSPNLLTIGNDETAETVRYTKIAGNVLTVERGFQSEAKSWSAGTKVARYFTAYDHDTFRGNIEDHETRIEAHIADGVRHVTAAERSTWNGKETPDGAQAKANTAESNARSYADTKSSQAETNAKNHTNTIVGSLSQLQTANKSNVVGALNEVFQSGVDAKQRVVDAINAMGGSASTNDDWATLEWKIRAIETGVKMAKGVTSAVNVPNMYVEVRGLKFRPNLVVVGNGDIQRLYGNQNVYPGGSGMLDVTYSKSGGIRQGSGWEIYDDGFKAQIHQLTDYNWAAFA